MSESLLLAVHAMIFRVFCPERPISDEVYAPMISEAAIHFANIVFGSGWKMIKVFESSDGKSAIVLSPSRRPFKIHSI